MVEKYVNLTGKKDKGNSSSNSYSKFDGWNDSK